MTGLLPLFLTILVSLAGGSPQPPLSQSRMFEYTFESRKTYADPFNDVDVDVVFEKDGESWRVPTFWRGSNKWTVRFAPPTPGEYTYHLECTDPTNLDLNGHEGRVNITPYEGTNALLKGGMIKVSADKRYFESADGTPFYWLGDTWWTGMSDRLSWDGFQRLTADRKAKGFTVVQIVAGLVPSNEEQAPSDPGFCNEGGCAWEPGFKSINPKFFDYADRRVQYLVDSGIAPAIVGAWHQALEQMGVAKMKKHWRYIIARYGAYPVFWIVGGEVYDPPTSLERKFAHPFIDKMTGWTEVARYIRATDPYHHPVTVHEISPPYDTALEDESLTDFDLFQPSHFGWPSIAAEVALLDMCRSRTSVAKPEVVGEIGYEKIGGIHLEDFQRVAFWLAVLNGAAGYTYGAVPIFEAYTSDKPFQRFGKYSFLTWEEGMNFPGAYQIGIAAKLVQQYPWWRFTPHPEWVSPRGTTLLEPRGSRSEFNFGTFDSFFREEFPQLGDMDYPAGEWKMHKGTFFLPYAAGIPSEVRFIYVPCFGLNCSNPPTVLGLESGVRYHTYYWEPSLGIRIDLGAVERPPPGDLIFGDNFQNGVSSKWIELGTKSLRSESRMSARGDLLAVLDGINEANLVASVQGHKTSDAELVLRYHDRNNYIVGVYSANKKEVYLLNRKNGIDGLPLGETAVPTIGRDIRLSAEVRGPWAAVSITDGQYTYTSRIEAVSNRGSGAAGLRHENDGVAQSFGNFELRASPVLVTDEHLERKLYDAKDVYRGELAGPGWDDFGREKIILLDAYRPPKLPVPQDWLLVLDARK
jgi:hypothetical protein